MESVIHIPTWNIKQEETEQDIKYALYSQMDTDSVNLNAMNIDVNLNSSTQELDYKVETTPNSCQSCKFHFLPIIAFFLNSHQYNFYMYSVYNRAKRPTPRRLLGAPHKRQHLLPDM